MWIFFMVGALLKSNGMNQNVTVFRNIHPIAGPCSCSPSKTHLARPLNWNTSQEKFDSRILSHLRIYAARNAFRYAFHGSIEIRIIIQTYIIQLTAAKISCESKKKITFYCFHFLSTVGVRKALCVQF